MRRDIFSRMPRTPKPVQPTAWIEVDPDPESKEVLCRLQGTREDGTRHNDCAHCGNCEGFVLCGPAEVRRLIEKLFESLKAIEDQPAPGEAVESSSGTTSTEPGGGAT